MSIIVGGFPLETGDRVNDGHGIHGVVVGVDFTLNLGPHALVQTMSGRQMVILADQIQRCPEVKGLGSNPDCRICKGRGEQEITFIQYRPISAVAADGRVYDERRVNMPCQCTMMACLCPVEFVRFGGI